MIRPERPLAPIALIFAVSGAAGLVQEVVWARALGQTLGGALPSLTLVLAVFLSGLALGSAAGARLAGRAASPLRLYALLELFLAAWALLGPRAAGVVEAGVRWLGPSTPPGLPLLALRLTLAALVLIPPTLAMGATFPLLVREAAERGAPADTAVSVLYGANTIGAAAGALFGSFAFLPFLGTRLAFACAGSLNALAGALALVLLRLRPAAGAPAAVPQADDAGPGVAPRARALADAGKVALAVGALSGAAGAILQVGWVRIMALSFGSSVYALGLTLAAYILGLGIGPLLAGRPYFRRASATSRAAGALWLVGLTSLLLLPLLGRLPDLAVHLSALAESHPARMVALLFALAAVILLLPTMAQGASFPPLAILAGGGRGRPHEGAGRLYAASAIGSVFGSVAAGFVLLPALGTQRTLAAGSAAALGLCAALLLARPLAGSERRPARARPALLLLVPAPLLLLALPGWDRDLLAAGGFLYGPVYRAAAGEEPLREAVRRRGTLLFYQDRGEGLVTVRRSPAGILSLQINGKTEASTGGDMATQLLAAHLPLLAHPAPERALVIGLASGVSLGAAERHPLRSVRVIEITPAVAEAARLFDSANGRSLDDPRLEVVIDDARSVLLAREDRYDVIASQPSNPWVAGVANLFTVEFYRLARRRLLPGGIFCQWVQAYRLQPDALRGIVGSFLEAFPHATLWEESPGGGDYFLLGSDAPLRIDPRRLEAAGESVWDDLRRAGVFGAADLLSRFVAGPAGLREFSAGARRHTDDDLYLEWRAPLALFSETLQVQTAALARLRQPVSSILTTGALRRDPDLAAALGARRRGREARLAVARSLREADLWALRDPFLAAGVEALRGGRFVEAAGALARAAAGSPDSASVHLLLGEAYLLAGLEDAAVVALEAAVLRDAGLAPAWNALGRIFAGRGQVEMAREAFERAVAGTPVLPQARNNLGALLLREGDLEGAERRFREALQEEPALAAAEANLGLVFKRRGDLKEAERRYRAALDLDPQNDDARYNLAGLLRSTGRIAEARRELLELLRINPADRDAEKALRETGTRPPQAGRSSGTS